MEVAVLASWLDARRLGLVVSVRVKGVVVDDVILEQRLQVLEAVLGEQEGIDLGSELLKGVVAWCEECTSGVVSGVQLIEETGLQKAELECAEVLWHEVDGLDGGWWWEERRVETVDHTVGAEDVDGDDAGVEVDGQTSEADSRGEALGKRLRAKVVGLEESREGVGGQDFYCRSEVWNNLCVYCQQPYKPHYWKYCVHDKTRMP